MNQNGITDDDYRNLCQNGFKESMVNELKQLVASINSRKGPREEKLDYEDLLASVQANTDYLFDGNLDMSNNEEREQLSRAVLKSLERVFQMSQRKTIWNAGSKKQKNRRRKTHKKRRTRKTKSRRYRK